jgi:hypothetical protein
VRLQVALGQIDKIAATDKLVTLFDLFPADSEEAAIHFELWQLDKERKASRQAAAKLYRDLYERTPNIEYRRCYKVLTGNSLPDPPPLPRLPQVMSPQSVNLHNLLARIESLMEDVDLEKENSDSI